MIDTPQVISIIKTECEKIMKKGNTNPRAVNTKVEGRCTGLLWVLFEVLLIHNIQTV
jgi:hypothetical protein